MAKTVKYTSQPLDETDDARIAAPSVKLFLKDTNDAGDPVTGNDRYYIAVNVHVDGDDGSVAEDEIVRQLTAVPAGILSNADKLELIRICKAAYNAARKVATND
jgi:hypothetical protein